MKKTIKKAQDGLRKALKSFRCVSPGDCPGGRSGPKPARWTKRQQREHEKYAEMKDRERYINKLPQLVKRKVIGEFEDFGPGPSYERPASFELERRTGTEAKRGKKVMKSSAKLKVAKKGIKKSVSKVVKRKR